jgi:multicomponent Na+:H+ antiporter subunit E
MMIRNFLMNLLLSFIWVALTGSMYYSNFLFGFMIGFFILWIMNREETDQRYFNRVPKTIGFVFYFLYEMIVANIQVAYDVITPKYFFRPGIVRYPLEANSDIEINLLSTMISMTPGTLILDISEDKKSLFIHVMYLKDKEAFIAQIKNGFEKKLLEILR